MASVLSEYEGFLREQIEVHHITHKQLSTELQNLHPGIRGFSVRSIENFCKEKEIHKSSRLSVDEVQLAVAEAVRKVGPTYGRKTIAGILSAEGTRVSERRVGQALRSVNPHYHTLRRLKSDIHFNPVPYNASFFGQKLHVDQNEKLVMYGVTHICAVDGYSNMIVGYISIPVKNPVQIYQNLFRPLMAEHGIWQQIRVDHGKEWVLMLFVQEQLAHLRRDTSKPPHCQTTSKLNHTVERIWPEVNSRVNYPIKRCLVDMQEKNEFDMDNEVDKFCISWFTLQVARVGISLFIQSWNNHRIPGKGVPLEKMRQQYMTSEIHPDVIPSTESAVQRYESLGGNLTLLSRFGIDALQDEHMILERDARFNANIPTVATIFHHLVNGYDTHFRNGLKYFITVTKRLSSSGQ